VISDCLSDSPKSVDPKNIVPVRIATTWGYTAFSDRQYGKAVANDMAFAWK